MYHSLVEASLVHVVDVFLVVRATYVTQDL